MAGDITSRVGEMQKGTLPDELGILWERVADGKVTGGFVVAPRHMAANGFLHAASVVALLDSACGYGCLASLPAGARGFTTIELKTNFLGTAALRERVICTATLSHGGRSTQVWDAEARNETTGRTTALFRCTQMILYPAGA